MKYVIWNKTTDQFWSERNMNNEKGHWSNRYYATKYTIEEIEEKSKTPWFENSEDLVLAVIALFV